MTLKKRQKNKPADNAAGNVESQNVYDDLVELDAASAEDMEHVFGGAALDPHSATHRLENDLIQPSGSSTITNQLNFISTQIENDIDHNKGTWSQTEDYEQMFDGAGNNMYVEAQNVTEGMVKELGTYLNSNGEVLNSQGVYQFVKNVESQIDDQAYMAGFSEKAISAGQIAEAWQNQHSPAQVSDAMFTATQAGSSVSHLEMNSTGATTLQEQAQVEAIESALYNDTAYRTGGPQYQLSDALSKEEQDCGALLQTLEQDGHTLDSNGLAAFLNNVRSSVETSDSAITVGSSDMSSFSIDASAKSFEVINSTAIANAENAIGVYNQQYSQVESQAGLQLTNAQIASEVETAENKEVLANVLAPRENQAVVDGTYENLDNYASAATLANQIENSNSTLTSAREITQIEDQVAKDYAAAEATMAPNTNTLANADQRIINDVLKADMSTDSIIQTVDDRVGITQGLENSELVKVISSAAQAVQSAGAGAPITESVILQQVLKDEAGSGPMTTTQEMKTLAYRVESELGIASDAVELAATAQVEEDYAKYGAFDVQNSGMTVKEIQSQVAAMISPGMTVSGARQELEQAQQIVRDVELQDGIQAARENVQDVRQQIAQDSQTYGEYSQQGLWWTHNTVEASTEALSADAALAEQYTNVLQNSPQVAIQQLDQYVVRMFENQSGITEGMIATQVQSQAEVTFNKAEQYLGWSQQRFQVAVNQVDYSLNFQLDGNVSFNITESRQSQISNVATAILQADGIPQFAQELAQLQEEQNHPFEYAVENFVNSCPIMAGIVGAVTIGILTVATAGAVDGLLLSAGAAEIGAEVAAEVGAAAGAEAAVETSTTVLTEAGLTEGSVAAGGVTAAETTTVTATEGAISAAQSAAQAISETVSGVADTISSAASSAAQTAGRIISAIDDVIPDIDSPGGLVVYGGGGAAGMVFGVKAIMKEEDSSSDGTDGPSPGGSSSDKSSSSQSS